MHPPFGRAERLVSFNAEDKPLYFLFSVIANKAFHHDLRGRQGKCAYQWKILPERFLGSLYPFPGDLYHLLSSWNLPWVHHFGEQWVTQTSIWNFLYSLSICSICHCIQQILQTAPICVEQGTQLFQVDTISSWWISLVWSFCMLGGI